MANKMPTGGKKGGAMFPRVNLAAAVAYSKRAVSKTYTGPQTSQTLYKGAFDAAGPKGGIRASALKQFGLLGGTTKDHVSTQLAIDIESAPDGENLDLLQKAALHPAIFSGLYETFKGDTTNLAKIRQQASQLKVHPDNSENCAVCFVDSMRTAGLIQNGEGDDFIIGTVGVKMHGNNGGGGASNIDEDGEAGDAGSNLDENGREEAAAAPGDKPERKNPKDPAAELGTPSARAVIHVNINLDSSLDTDKLQKQLELLRRFGAI